MKELIKNNIMRFLALLICIGLYYLTLEPKLAEDEKTAFIQEFNFIHHLLYSPSELKPQNVRKVHPHLDRISAWVSSVGAAITITDIDNDGRSDELIHIDPRYDKVIISEAIPNKLGFKPMVLEPGDLYFDIKTMAPMGTLTHDFNEDGQTDVLVYYWGRPPILFYQQDEKFTPVELDVPNARWFSNAGTLADFNGDGHTDILITNYFKDGSRILDENATDNEQEMHHSFSRAYNGGNNHLYLWSGLKNGEAIFKENLDWEKDIRYPTNWTLGVAAADLDGDLLPEIYFANDLGPDILLHNRYKDGVLNFQEIKGKRRMTDIPSSVIGKDSFKGMGADFTDIDMDGDLDLYVSNIADIYALEESHFMFINSGNPQVMQVGIAPFVNESETLGLSRSSWGWDSKLADFNNDGIPEAVQATGFVKGDIDRWAELQELAMGNDEIIKNPYFWPRLKPGDDLSGHDHNPFFVCSKSGRYFDIAKEIGLGKEHVTRGIAIGDIDHDGDRDFVIANQWDESFLYENNYKGENTFLGLRLQVANDTLLSEILVDPSKSLSTRDAIGATVKIDLPNGKKLIDFIDGGNGHSGVNSKEIFLGLSDWPKGKPISIQIEWVDNEGNKQQSTSSLIPGWHTIVLSQNPL